MSAPRLSLLRALAALVPVAALALAGCTSSSHDPTSNHSHLPRPTARAEGPQTPEPRTMPTSGIWSYTTTTEFASWGAGEDAHDIILPTLEGHVPYAMRVTGWKTNYYSSEEWRLRLTTAPIRGDLTFGTDDGGTGEAAAIWLPLVSKGSDTAEDPLLVRYSGGDAAVRLEIMRLDEAPGLRFWDGESPLEGTGTELIRTSHSIDPSQITLKGNRCAMWSESAETGTVLSYDNLRDEEINGLKPLSIDALFIACQNPDEEYSRFDVYSQTSWTLTHTPDKANS